MPVQGHRIPAPHHIIDLDAVSDSDDMDPESGRTVNRVLELPGGSVEGDYAIVEAANRIAMEVRDR